MKRKQFGVLLVVMAIVLTLMPTSNSAQATGEADEVRETVAQQYDAFAATLNKSKINEAAIRQLLNHAIAGNGKHLTMGENDSVTGAMFNSNNYRAFMIDALVCGVDLMQSELETECLLGSVSLAWHDFTCQYTVLRYAYNDTKDMSDDVRKGTLKEDTTYTGTINSNDKAMMLVVGGAKCRIRMNRTNVTADEITYRVQVFAGDTFEFNSDYDHYDEDGYDTSLSKLINKVGKILDYGLLDTYTWDISADFELTVPNTCTHEGGSYRWEYDGTDLVCVTKDGNSPNALTRKQKTKTDGTLGDPYYQTAKTVYLLHDMPWVVEFRVKGGKSFALSPADSLYVSEKPSLLRTWNLCAASIDYTYKEYDAEQGKDAWFAGAERYGIMFKDYGYKNHIMYTYRLENRIASDGTNMVYLLIDGEELGPMDDYHLVQRSKYTDQKDQENWFCGKDFAINYIFNSSVGFASTLEVEYVQIWEKGENETDYSYLKESVTKPTCTQPGYTTCVCKLCGASFTKNPVSARGHNYASAVTQPTCTEQGYTTYTCNDCGDSYTDSYQSALGHSYGPWNEVKAPSCTEAGQQYRECAQCGHREDHSIAEKGHSLVQHEGKPASCTESGWQAYETCNDCEYSTYTEIPALGHHHDAVTTAATCTEDGYTTYTCACGDTYTEVIAATGHQYNAVVTAPTCTESGYTTHTCGNCGDTYTADAVAATGHHYETVTVDPSCTAEGSMTHTCHCGETYTEVIAMIPHSYVEGKCEHCGVLSVTLGDVNGDGNVNVRDARLLLRYVTALTEENELVLLAAADVNGDGRVNVRDARAILIYVVGLA